jgi:hypothetical protein
MRERSPSRIMPTADISTVNGSETRRRDIWPGLRGGRSRCVPGRCRRGQPCQAGWNQRMPRSPSGGLNRLILTGGALRLLSDVCRPSASPARLARGPGGGQPPLAVPERPARRETSRVGVEEAHTRKRRRARRGRREVPRSRRGPQCLRPADPRSHRAGAGLKDVTADEIHLPTSGSS